ncbi:MFS transporter [Nocardia sp. NBC_00508]|uniref:MFS transporter n=1 Tax=Nocardia sp. NBC_00508 TaxID=2975992 RepID=UPI002E813BD3|nr:MFS transporter [Nocardia sp. NBC_00508]WUD69156.1 MFS transporter [Nocardia sp. NBC_00508]
MSEPRIIRIDRDFALLWSGNAASLVGFYGVRLAYPLLVLSVTHSPALAGWVGFAVMLPSLVFQIPAGIAADYGNRRRNLLLCQSGGLAATCLAIAVVMFELPNPAMLLMITAFVEGTSYVFFEASELAAIRDIVDVEHRRVALAFFEAEQPVALVVGRATGAAAYGVAQWLPFAMNAVSYVFCRETLQSIQWGSAEQPPRSERTGPGVWKLIRDGAQIIWTEPFLRTTTVIGGLSNLVIQVGLLLIMVELERGEGATWTIGIVLGAAGVGGIIGSAVASKLVKRFGRTTVYRSALWAWTALLLPISLSSNPVVLAVCWFGVGGVGVMTNVLLTIFRVEVIPEKTLGRTIGTLSMVTDGSAAIGTLLAGYLLSGFGTTGTGVLLTCAMFVIAVSGSRMTTPAQQRRVRR